jgi:hypothetical protein
MLGQFAGREEVFVFDDFGPDRIFQGEENQITGRQ